MSTDCTQSAYLESFVIDICDILLFAAPAKADYGIRVLSIITHYSAKDIVDEIIKIRDTNAKNFRIGWSQVRSADDRGVGTEVRNVGYHHSGNQFDFGMIL